MVQWLGLCSFTARGMGSIPGQGTKISHVLVCSLPTHPKKVNGKQSRNGLNTNQKKVRVAILI